MPVCLSYRLVSIGFLVLVASACTHVDTPLRPELESFDRQADYDYRLGSLEGASSYRIDLLADGFAWPELRNGADTALLEFTLIRSQGTHPSIETQVDGNGIRQYFEHGGRGRRYLDISPLLGMNIRPGTFVRLVGSGTAWVAGVTALTTFSNAPLNNRRVLVVAPHPDDAEIAAFGVYQDSNADVVTVTAGDAGGESFIALWPETGEHYRAKGKIRALDSLTVPFLGGLGPDEVRNLGYYDATLQQLWLNRPAIVPPLLAQLEDPALYRRLNFDAELRDRPFRSTWKNLVSDLLAELKNVDPQTIVVPHPRLDRHGDHRLTAIALFEALQAWEGDAELLLYTNHAIGNEAYPLGPRDGMTGLPAWRDGDLHITGVYSHQLSVESQRLKLVALEAMHDLRPFNLRDGGPVAAVTSIYDYFRRGPRPNEIFLVTDLDGARALYRAFAGSAPR